MKTALAALLLLALAAPADARGRHHHHRYGHGFGFPLIGGIVVGGALTAAIIAEQRDREYRRERCAREHDTYDRYSGTVLIDGRRVVCPYL